MPKRLGRKVEKVANLTQPVTYKLIVFFCPIRSFSCAPFVLECFGPASGSTEFAAEAWHQDDGKNGSNSKTLKKYSG